MILLHEWTPGQIYPSRYGIKVYVSSWTSREMSLHKPQTIQWVGQLLVGEIGGDQRSPFKGEYWAGSDKNTHF